MTGPSLQHLLTATDRPGRGRDERPDGPRPAPPTYQQIEAFGYQRFTNREQSRLDFGARLLDLAEDDGVPLLERAKFLAIFSELLDEFYQVRVAALEDQVAAGVRTRSVDGLRPGEQLTMIRARVEELVRRQDAHLLGPDRPGLGGGGHPLLGAGRRSTTTTVSTWSTSSSARSSRPHAAGGRPRSPVPLHLEPLAQPGGRGQDPATGEGRIARVKVPPVLPRFVVMPDGERFVPLEQVIAAHLDHCSRG